VSVPGLAPLSHRESWGNCGKIILFCKKRVPDGKNIQASVFEKSNEGYIKNIWIILKVKNPLAMWFVQ